MICFCHQSLQPLRLALPSLNVSASMSLPNADLVQALANWLGARALPAPPWMPDPAWVELPLPRMSLNASAMATISALAQLRAQVLAQFGIDLLLPGQARAFASIVATMNARISAMAVANFNPLAWLRLAALNGAIDQLTLALKLGLPFQLPAAGLPMPGGLPMASWRQFLTALSALAPMIAVAAQLNVNLSANFTASLALAIRPLSALVLPQLPSLSLMASLTAALSAVAQLRASLSIDPLQIGLPAVQEMVALRLSALMQALPACFPFDPLALLLDELLALLPPIPYCPTSLATQAVVAAAMSINAQALASLNWQVPAAMSLSAISVGLPAVAFSAQLQASLGINAAIQAPCGSGCDAQALLF
jgi:hypothetical protein